MKHILTAIVLLFALTVSADAQLFEDFEQGTKGGYAAGTVEMETGVWFYEQALLGRDNNDRKNGAQSVRMRESGGVSGFARMNFDKANGAGFISFYGANAGFANDTGGQVQVQFSTNQGSSWEDIGGPVVLSNTLEQYELEVNEEGNIRFRFVHAAGGRINIDDFFVSDYVEATEEPTISVQVAGGSFESGGQYDFPPTSIGSERAVTVTIRNLGEDTLTMSSVEAAGVAFSAGDLSANDLAFNQTSTFQIFFSPETGGEFDGSVTINSNAVNEPTFGINLTGEAFAEGDVITISEARQLPFGTRVTVAGRATVADEFNGPVFMQDATAGIAVFWPDLHAEVEIGDSLVVTGPLTEFNPINGTPGTFLRQIAPIDGDDNITYTVFSDNNQPVEPVAITIAGMNAGGFEAQLVQINDLNVLHSGAFQGNTNYDVEDATDSGLMRIDAATNLVGALAPDEPVNVVGVIDRFNGIYQFKPRFVEDLGTEETVYPGDDVPKSETFDVVTWNIQFFGAPNQGPDDVELQYENVKTIITTIDADLYALQEISNVQLFNQLVEELEDFSGFTATFSQTQKTAYLYRNSTIEFLDSGLLSTGQNQADWAGRLPLWFHFNVTLGSQTREVHAYNVHAKAFGDLESYQQRQNASTQLKTYLDANRQDANVLFIGDYNDELRSSIYENQTSPYDNFVQDDHYHTITISLEDRGFTSYRSQSMIDHISATNQLAQEHIAGAERLENVSYIGSYLTTTSDHFPVWTRFDLQNIVSVDEPGTEIPQRASLDQNYPNPFNPTTNIRFELPDNQQISLAVYDVMGRRVATLVNNEHRAAGTHTVSFNASTLASGVYLYRLSLGNGQHLTQKMMLVK